MLDLLTKLTKDLGGLNSLGSDSIDQVMNSIDAISRSAFETEYTATAFKHATGRYHDAIQYNRISKNQFRVSATAAVPGYESYASFLEWGQRSFRGYNIMERTAERIAEEAQSNLNTIVEIYCRKV